MGLRLVVDQAPVGGGISQAKQGWRRLGRPGRSPQGQQAIGAGDGLRVLVPLHSQAARASRAGASSHTLARNWR